MTRKVLEEDEKFLILIMGHAVHIAILVVDIKTGDVKFLMYVAVHDVGTVGC